MQASLLLEDGSFFHGQGIGFPTDIIGEIVFNTAMTGYEEVLSDPSYLGQIVLFTNSYIGNTGITVEDLESKHMFAEAMICKNISFIPDNFRAKYSLHDFLYAQKKCAIYDIDTRLLVQKTRNHGCLFGIISTCDHDLESLKQKLKNTQKKVLQNTVSIYNDTQKLKHFIENKELKKYKVAVFDFGIKQGILDSLAKLGCEVFIISYPYSLEALNAIQLDGIFFSNGSGDPNVLANETEIINTMQYLLNKYPCFGICLGHQLIGLSFGAKIKKLNSGHHAINHPVKALLSQPQKVMITSQNHNYVVDIENIQNDFDITHIHLNDETLAGMKHKRLPIFSVQFHPEANPGPRDAEEIFLQFIELMDSFQKEKSYAQN